MPFVAGRSEGPHCSHALTRELMTLRNSGPPGTIGTVGTMVPCGGGGRVNRGPRDHQEAIIYMSCATPRKGRGRLVGLAHGRQGLASGGPLHYRGPWSRRSRWSRGCRRPHSAGSCALPSFGRRVSAFRSRRCSARRDHRGRWSRQNDEGSAPPLAKRGVRHCQHMARPPTSGSVRSLMPASPAQPAVIFAPRDPGPSYSRASPGRGAARWLRRWLQTSHVFERGTPWDSVDQLRTFGRTDAGHDGGDRASSSDTSPPCASSCCFLAFRRLITRFLLKPLLFLL